MQCSVNKIFRCIYSGYLLAASVYSVVYNTKSMSGQLQFKNPGGPAHDRNAWKAFAAHTLLL